MRNVKVSVYSPVEEDRKITLSGSVFNVEVNTQVMFDAVQVYQSNMRQATAKTKTRDEVSGVKRTFFSVKEPRYVPFCREFLSA